MELIELLFDFLATSPKAFDGIGAKRIYQDDVITIVADKYGERKIKVS